MGILVLCLGVAFAAPVEDDRDDATLDAAQTAVDVGGEVVEHLAAEEAVAAPHPPPAVEVPAAHADDVFVPVLPEGAPVGAVADDAAHAAGAVAGSVDDVVRAGAHGATAAAEGAGVAARGLGQAASHADDLLRLIGVGAAGAGAAAAAAAKGKKKD